MENTTKRADLSVCLISDSLGETAATMVSAALSQFGELEVEIERLAKVTSAKQVAAYFESCRRPGGADGVPAPSMPQLVFYTITDMELREDVVKLVSDYGVLSVDLISPAINAIVRVTGRHPLLRSGANRRLDAEYFRRIEAMDYAVDHDDGRLPEEYKDADIVLVGVSRTSKTPLSMYLASHGYKVANLPLAPGMKPPRQIYDVEPWRVYGLISSPSVLSEIRARRLGPEGAKVAAEYASEEYIERDLDEARAFMRTLGCIVIRTDNRAIEETAQEILSYYLPAAERHAKM